MQHLFDQTVPVFIKALKNLDSQISKAEAHVAADAQAPFPQTARLAPDMFPFAKQVQIATDNARLGVARLTGKEMPSFADNEVSFAELHERITKTIELLSPLTAADFDGAADRKIELKYYPDQHMTGANYTQEYLVPNFFFHVAIAYAILRNAGVPIGKADFLGSLPLVAND